MKAIKHHPEGCMSWRITWAILRKELLHIWRDGQTWVLVVFTPAILLVMFAYLFAFDVDRFDLYLWDQDNSPASRQYVRVLTSDGVIHLQRSLRNWDEIHTVLVRERPDAVMIIPPRFGDLLQSGQTPAVQVLVDGSNPTTASQVLADISARTAAYSQQIALQMMDSPPIAGGLFEVRDIAWYNRTLKSLFSMVPGLLAVVLIMPAFSAAQALAKEKELGTLETLLSTPVRRAELIIGKGLPYLFTGLIGVLLTAAVAVLWFRVPFRGNFVLFLLLGLDFLFASNFLGLMLANFTESQQAVMIAMFIIFFLPSFFLSGLIHPVETAGLGARIESAVLPATYFVAISRGIFLKGVGMEHLWKYALGLLALGAGALALAILSFKNRLA
jgi:ABC-2 type transport system permease protein